MSTPDELFPVCAEEYGARYRDDLLEQYTLFVQMADKISERRQSANTYFLSINSFLVTLYGLLAGSRNIPQQGSWQYFVPVAGLLLCITWATLILSYRQLNSSKFYVIRGIEAKLPASPYRAEWASLSRKRRFQYIQFTHVEICVPWIFAGLYTILIAFSLLKGLHP